ncbi:MAG TPA: hypothetical protein VL048_10245 [Xanthobacteraceae bacterium]|nr:hypothetical protein [Xanthobacteraceae bacterium]
MLDHDDALHQIGSGHPPQDFVHPGDDVSLAPVAVSEQDQARTTVLHKGEQARIIQIRGNDRSMILFGARYDD